MEQRTKILFHSLDGVKHCFDGFAAAYCAWKVLGESAEYIPVIHDFPPPRINPGDMVYLLDFSYPRSLIEQIREVAEKVVILDHHKTAALQLLGIEGAIFDMNKSGAVLAWEYWHPSQPAPALIKYISDRDLWSQQLPYTEEVNAALSIFPQDFVVLDTLAKLPNYVDFMRRIGEPIRKRRENQIKQLMGTAQIEEVAGFQVPVIRTNKHYLISDTCNRLCQKYREHPFAANCYSQKSPKMEKWSLRSIGEFDVSLLATQFGGGGHKNAAGFTVDLSRKG